MLGSGGKVLGLSAGAESEPQGSYDSAANGSYCSCRSAGGGLGRSGGRLLPVEALLAGMIF